MFLSLLPKVSLDLGHEPGMVGGAHTRLRGRDNNVEPIIVETFTGNLKMDTALRLVREPLTNFGNDGRHFQLRGHNRVLSERFKKLLSVLYRFGNGGAGGNARSNCRNSSRITSIARFS
jgi:hypothetical protein